MKKKRKFSTRLITSIRKRKWNEVNKYIDEANLPDSTNTFALHQICGDSTAPMKNVSDIYHAYPMAAKEKDCHQETPLSIATQVGFEEAVRFLAKECPESCIICCSHGSTPLLSVIFQLNFNNMIDDMIAVSPKAAFIRDEDGDNAFDYFFHNWNVFMRIAVHDQTNHDEALGKMIGHGDNAFDYFFHNWNVFMRIAVHDQTNHDEALGKMIGHGDWNVRNIYQKTCLFLKAANLCRRGKILDDSCLLHCALREETCHWAFCKSLMKLHPEQILTKDDDGNLPIHIILSCKESSDEKTILCSDCFAKESELTYVELLNGDSKCCCDYCLERDSIESITKLFYVKPVLKVSEIVKELLDLAPQMVLISGSDGNYPIHIAIRNHQSFTIVSELFQSLPETGKIRDVKTELVPFMQAAIGNWTIEKDQISIIYHLLKEDPHLIFEA